jgi:hypothetical protein
MSFLSLCKYLPPHPEGFIAAERAKTLSEFLPEERRINDNLNSLNKLYLEYHTYLEINL